MTPKLASRHETRTALLQAGMQLMIERGYTNTGIQEVLNVVKVPKGSFYHYFDSKEAFAVEIIRYFDAHEKQPFLALLRNQERRPIDRLRDYVNVHRESLLAQGCRGGCLVGNLSQEMADQSEVLRAELSSVMMQWRETVAACIAEGQAAGEIRSTRKPEELADLFSAAWYGAMMRAKTVKSTEPIDIIVDLLFDEIFKA